MSKPSNFGGSTDKRSMEQAEKKYHPKMDLVENPNRRAPLRKIILQGLANSGLYSSAGQFTNENELMVALVKEIAVKGVSDEATPQEQKNHAMLLERVLPPLKSSMESFQLSGYDRNLDTGEKANLVLDLIMSGEIPPDVGSVYLENIKRVAEIDELKDVLERLEKLEGME